MEPWLAALPPTAVDDRVHGANFVSNLMFSQALLIAQEEAGGLFSSGFVASSLNRAPCGQQEPPACHPCPTKGELPY